MQMMIPHNPSRPTPPLLHFHVVGFIKRQRFGRPELLWQSGLPDHWMSGQSPRRVVVGDVDASFWLMELYNWSGRWHANKQTRSKPTCLISWKSAGNENVIVWLDIRRNNSFIKLLEGSMQGSLHSPNRKLMCKSVNLRRLGNSSFSEKVFVWGGFAVE